MNAQRFETCKLCHTEFISSKELKNGMCRSCSLDVAWRNFVLALAESLRIDRFVMWLAEKLKKREGQNG